MKKITLFIPVFVLLFVNISYSQTASDYLILQDIGWYKLTKGFLFKGRIVGAEPKVSNAGNDVSGYYTSYETSYAGGEGYSAPKVEVRVYSITSQWLLHEVERGYRRGNYEENMTPARFRNIGNSNIFYSGLGGGTYRWLSNNVVINIEYVDLYKQKPEPLEVVKAYLAKFPSTILAVTIDKAHDEKWIKDEMERRLWLCDKWYKQFQLGKVEQDEMLKELVDHMSVFLDYRERYYGIKAYDEKVALSNYLYQNNGTAIKNKLTECKTWWSANKGKAINLP